MLGRSNNEGEKYRNSPGPGSYNPVPMKKKLPAYRIGTEIRSSSNEKYSNPSPVHYKPSLSSIIANSPSWG